MTPRELAERWRADADVFDRYADTQLAKIARVHADELAAALAALDDDALDLATAARESGYSVDRLRHMIAPKGKPTTPDRPIPNAGRKGAPRVRRADLPRKPRAKTAGNSAGFDAAGAAREMLSLHKPTGTEG